MSKPLIECHTHFAGGEKCLFRCDFCEDNWPTERKSRKPRGHKPPITKPYVVPINIDNKPLPYKSVTTKAHILAPDKPSFWIVGFGFTEFMVMKTARQEYPGSQVLEIKNV